MNLTNVRVLFHEPLRKKVKKKKKKKKKKRKHGCSDS
jgi:hypothetical protein